MTGRSGPHVYSVEAEAACPVVHRFDWGWKGGGHVIISPTGRGSTKWVVRRYDADGTTSRPITAYPTLAEAQASVSRHGKAGWYRVDRRAAKTNPAAKRPGKRRAFQAQEILLEKPAFTLARARAWLAKNGHRYGHLSESENFIHARQHDAGGYQKGTLHNIALAKHVEAVVGIPKAGSDAAGQKGYGKRGPRQGRLFRAGGPVGDASDVVW